MVYSDGMETVSKIFVAGHKGLVGSAVVRKLTAGGFKNIMVAPKEDLDLRQQGEVDRYLQKEKPEYVFLCAARVGGIMANAARQADFLYDNIMIAANVISAAYRTGVKKLINLGSSCIYPRLAPQPLKEEYLLSGPLEPTNEGYAVAKIAALKLCRYYNEQYGTNFLSVMPTNLYGPGDNFDLNTSHVLPALLRKIYAARERGEDTVEIWGDGSALREFLYVDDLADALVFLMDKCSWRKIGEIINIGVGTDLSIRELALLIKEIVGYQGEFRFDAGRPNGTPRKLLDVSRMKRLGWKAGTDLRAGIRKTLDWYIQATKAGRS